MREATPAQSRSSGGRQPLTLMPADGLQALVAGSLLTKGEPEETPAQTIKCQPPTRELEATPAGKTVKLPEEAQGVKQR